MPNVLRIFNVCHIEWFIYGNEWIDEINDFTLNFKRRNEWKYFAWIFLHSLDTTRTIND